MGKPADDARTIEHERTWTLSEILDLSVPTLQMTVREHLVVMTAKDAMDEQLADVPEHVVAFDADCDAVVQQMIRPDDGELCARVWVHLLVMDPDDEL
jgi:hypothetical protein